MKKYICDLKDDLLIDESLSMFFVLLVPLSEHWHLSHASQGDLENGRSEVWNSLRSKSGVAENSRKMRGFLEIWQLRFCSEVSLKEALHMYRQHGRVLRTIQARAEVWLSTERFFCKSQLAAGL